MDDVGKVASITTRRVGTALIGDHPAGATALSVYDAFDFDEIGGRLQAGDTVLTYTTCTTSDDETVPDTITLAAATTVALEDGVQVWFEPRSDVTTAAVILDETGEALDDVIVPQHLVPTLPDGIRLTTDATTLEEGVTDQYADAETVTIRQDEYGDWVIVSVDKARALIDGSNIDPDTLPPAPPTEPVAPAGTPQLEAAGGPGVVALSWTAVANPTPVMYDVHDVTATGDEITDTTLLHSTSATGYLVAPVDGVHRYRLWARSGDQYAPAPSDVVEVTPSADATSIIVANAFFAVDGVHVGAGDGPGHDFDLSGFVLRGAAGVPRVKMPTDVDQPVFVKGSFELETARAKKFVLGGRDNIIDRGGRLMMSAKVVEPERMQLTPVWPEIRFAPGLVLPFFMDVENGSIRNAVCYASSGTTRSFYATTSADRTRVIDLTVDLATNEITRLVAAGTVGSALQDDYLESIAFCNGSLWAMSTVTKTVRRYNPTTGARLASFSRPVSGNAQGIYAQGSTLKFWRHQDGQVGTWTINQADGTLTATTTFSHPASRGIPSRVQRGVFDEGNANPIFVTVDSPQPEKKARAYNATDGAYRGEWLQAPTRGYLWDLAWTNPDPNGAGEWISFGQWNSNLDGTRIGWRHDGEQAVSGDYADRRYIGITGAWARDAGQTYHTRLSDYAYLYAPRTARLQVSWGAWPALSEPPADTDPDRLFIYTAALGGATSLDEIGQLTDRSTQTTTVQSWAYHGPAQKVEADFAENTFPDLGGAGQIAASAGGFNVDGSSNGSWDLMKRPTIRRERTSAQPVVDGASSNAYLDVSAMVESEGSWTYSSSVPYPMTCQIGGFYVLVYSVLWDGATAGRRSIIPAVNGVATPERDDQVPGGSYPVGQQVVIARRFVPGDTVSLRTIQTSGATLDITSSSLTIMKASA